MQIFRRVGRIIIYIFAGFGVVTLTFASVLVFNFFFSEEVPLPDSIVLSIDIGGGIKEQQSGNLLDSFQANQGVVLRDLVTSISAASDDERVKGLTFEIGNAKVSVSDAQALRRVLSKFRASGKFVYAYSESYGGFTNGTVQYFLASIADEVWMQPSGMLGLVGIALEAPFVTSTLQKLKIKAHYEQRHEYKGGGDMFVRNGFSPEVRKTLQGLIDAWMNQMTGAIAKSRSLSQSRIEELIDRGPLIGREAKEARLIDRLAYREDLEKAIKLRAGTDSIHVSLKRYKQSIQSFTNAVKRIALIYGEGSIVPVKNEGLPIGGSINFAADTITDAIRDAVKDPKISAILLRINSPGGSYIASDTLWNTIRWARGKGKPVVASLGNSAASGGYFVAMACDRIVAEAGTITGSIGVFTIKFVTRQFWQNLGVEWDRIESGKMASIWSMIDDYPTGGSAKMEAFLNAVYEDFTQKVSKARNIKKEQINAIARGRIWSGEHAKKIGLVDKLGGLSVALDEVRELLELSLDTPLQLIELPKPSKFEQLAMTLRQQGFDIVTPKNGFLAYLGLVPSKLSKLTAKVLDSYLHQTGVVQMPMFRIAD